MTLLEVVRERQEKFAYEKEGRRGQKVRLFL
jgi:hypothetical protein